jgi:hypothetical protein
MRNVEDRVLVGIFYCARCIQDLNVDRRWPEPLGRMLRGSKTNLKEKEKIVQICRSLNIEVFDRAYTKEKMDEMEGQFGI